MANQRLNAVINIGGSVSKAFNSSIGTTQQRLEGVGDAIKGVERQQKRIDRFDIQGLRDTRDRLKQARGEVSRLGDQLADSRRSTRQAEQAYNGATDRVEQLADEMRRADEPSEVLRHDFEQARAEAKRLGKEFQNAQRDTKSLAEEHKQAEHHVDTLNTQFSDERRRLHEVREELREAGVDTRNLGDESERLARRMERLQRRQSAWKDVGQRTGRVGASFQRMNQEVGAFGRNASIAGAAVSAAMGTVVHSYARSTEEIDQWASRLGMSTSELSQWTGAGRQFGVQQEAMVDAFKELSMRSDEFIQTGKGPAADAFKRLGLTGDQLSKVSDDAGAMMGMVLERIRQIDDASARQRISDELLGGQGGEQLVEMISQSAKELLNLRREYDEFGATVNGLDGDQARDYMHAWRNAQNALVGVRNTFARQLLPLVTSGFTVFSGYVKENQEQIGEWAAAFADGIENALPTIIEIGKGFWRSSQMVGALVSQTADLVGGFDNLATIVGVALAGKAIASVFSFGTAVFGLGKALLSVSGVLPALSAGFKTLGLAIATTPVGWIVTGIAAIATGAYLIYRNWGSIGPWVADLWDGIKAKVGAAWDWFKETFSWHPLAMIANNWGGLSDWFGNLLSGVKSVASTAWEGLKTILAWSPVGLVAQAWGGVSGWFAGLWDGVMDSAQQAINWIAGKLEWVGNAFSKAKSWLGFGDDDSARQEGVGQTQRSAGGGPARPDLADIQPRQSSSDRQSSAQQPPTQNITNNVSLTVAAREGEGDTSYARRITEMVLDELNERQRGALYDG
ncbi:hypothetical protein M1D97_10270 [Kushneria sp. AK178]